MALELKWARYSEYDINLPSDLYNHRDGISFIYLLDASYFSGFRLYTFRGAHNQIFNPGELCCRADAHFESQPSEHLLVVARDCYSRRQYNHRDDAYHMAGN